MNIFMGKLKYTLISLLAVCLTAGGVFAAWSFSEGSIENPDPVGVDVSTEGLGGMEFMHVNIKFDANGGVYSGGETVKSITSKKYQAIASDAYTAAFGSYTDFPTKTVEGEQWCFSNWSTTVSGVKINEKGEEEHDYVSFDAGFEEDTTLYAIYVPSTNPAIYKDYDEIGKEDELLSYFRYNKQDDKYSDQEEYYLRNFIATGLKNHSKNSNTNTRGFHYVIKYENTSWPVLATFSGTYTNNEVPGADEFNIVEGKDYVINGLYNVYFNKDKITSTNYSDPSNGHTLGWKLYGDVSFFEAQYNYRLVGNPVASNTNGGWADPSPNPVCFSYVNKSTNSYGQTVREYEIQRVDFPFHDGESTREFKPYITHFAHYPLKTPSSTDKLFPQMAINSSTEENNLTHEYLEFSSDNANYKFKSTVQNIAFAVTMKVTYETRNPFAAVYEDGHEETFYTFNEYPIYMEISLEPINFKIKVYDSPNNDVPSEIIDIASNTKWTPSMPDVSLGNDVTQITRPCWRDYYTHKVVDFSNGVNKNYSVYLSEETVDNTTSTLTLYSVVKNNDVYSYQYKSIEIYKYYPISMSLSYYQTNNINTYNDTITSFLSSGNEIYSTGFTTSNDSFTFDGFVKDDHKTTNETPITMDALLNSKINENTVLKARFVSYTKPIYSPLDKKFVFKEVDLGSTYDSTLNNSIKTTNNFEYGHVLFIGSSSQTDTTKNYIFDPLQAKTTLSSSYGGITRGAFSATYNTNAKTRSLTNRIIVLSFNGGWNAASAKLAVYYYEGSNNGWAQAIDKKVITSNSDERSIYLIPTNYKSFVFTRGPSSYTTGWNGKWNQTEDVYLSNLGSGYGTSTVEYVTILKASQWK